MCSHFLIKNLDTSICYYIKRLAEILSLKKIESSKYVFIEDKFMHVTNDEQFLGLENYEVKVI